MSHRVVMIHYALVDLSSSLVICQVKLIIDSASYIYLVLRLNHCCLTYIDVRIFIGLYHNRVGHKPVCFLNMSRDNSFILALFNNTVSY